MPPKSKKKAAIGGEEEVQVSGRADGEVSPGPDGGHRQPALMDKVPNSHQVFLEVLGYAL